MDKDTHRDKETILSVEEQTDAQLHLGMQSHKLEKGPDS